MYADIPLFSPSSEGLCHGAHLDFNDPRTRGLFAGQQNRAGHVFGLQHVRVADPFLRPPPAKRKFGLHASGTDNTNLDSMNSEFLVQRLRKTDLRELRGTVNRFAPKPIDAPNGRNHQDGALLLLKHDRNRVTGEQKRGAHVGVHHVVVLLSACVHEVLIIAYPVLLIRMSICPKVCIAASTVFFAVLSSRASPRTLMACVPSFSACCLSSLSRSWRRAVSTSRAPSSAKARAQACPMPALAPVIRATFPVRFVVIYCYLRALSLDHKRLLPTKRSAKRVVLGVIRMSQRSQIERLKFGRLRNKRLFTRTDQCEYYCFHICCSFLSLRSI